MLFKTGKVWHSRTTVENLSSRWMEPQLNARGPMSLYLVWRALALQMTAVNALIIFRSAEELVFGLCLQKQLNRQEET